MKHRKKGRKLSRSSSHRKATRQNLAKALLEHERIITTPAKAKEAKSFVEKLITLARKARPFRDSDDQQDRANYLHYYRQALSKLQDKNLVQKLFGEGEWRNQEALADRYADRPSGQTRIIRLSGSRLGVLVGTSFAEIPVFDYTMAGKDRSLKLTGNRLGDNAEQCIFELVEKETEEAIEEDVEPAITISDDEPEGGGSEEEEVVKREEETPPETELADNEPSDTAGADRSESSGDEKNAEE
ncbi:MAG: 50S ribosomal protein L17 [Planctomycetota bacterium]